MFKGVFKNLTAERRRDRLSKAYRALINKEARMGGKLFGPVPATARREFFCLDAHTWVWHEEWVDSRGQRQIITTRYDVRPSGILKAQNNQYYQEVEPEEAQNLLKAARQYVAQARKDIYNSVY